MEGNNKTDGKLGKDRATQDELIAPISNCPSAPIFQRLALNASVRPDAQTIRGIPLTMVSENPCQLPNALNNILLYASRGLTP
jgi:hypothetical protein